MSGAEQVDIHDGSFQVGRTYKIRKPRVRGRPLNLKVKSKDRRAGLELAVEFLSYLRTLRTDQTHFNIFKTNILLP